MADLNQIMEGDGSEPIDLSAVPVMHLLRELKARSHAVVVVMVTDDEDGNEQTVVANVGLRSTCLGMMMDAVDQFRRFSSSVSEQG